MNNYLYTSWKRLRYYCTIAGIKFENIYMKKLENQEFLGALIDKIFKL